MGLGSSSEDRYARAIAEAIAPHVDGPVESMALLSRPGAVGGTILAALLGPLAGGLFGGRGKARAGGLPLNVVLALTPTTLFAFPFTPKGRGVKRTEPVARWPRHAVRIVPGPSRALGQTVRLEFPDQPAIELDSNQFPGMRSGFNDALIAALSVPAAG